MTSPEAAKLLELPVDATPEQIEARFLDLRRKLEDKIAKAPTPGLQAKYRESLTEITTAFETLALAADSSALPLLNKQSAVSSQPSAGTNASAAASSSGFRSQVSGLTSKPKVSNKEFLIVAVIALAVLGAGGWFVLKTRAENAAQARVAAELAQKAAADKAEADRRAEEARLALETRKKAEEEEKNRLAATAKAEQERVDLLVAKVRVELAEARLLWESVEREAQDAERALAELRSEARNLRDTEQGRRNELAARTSAAASYAAWVTNLVSTHAIKRTQVRTTELLAARQGDAAAAEVAGLIPAIEATRREITERKAKLDDGLFASVRVRVATSDDKWTLRDYHGREHRGITNQQLANVAVGPATFITHRAGWPDQSQELDVSGDHETEFTTRMQSSTVIIKSNVDGAEIVSDGRVIGTTPLTLSDLPPGAREYELRAPGHITVRVAGTAGAGRTLVLEGRLLLPTDAELIAHFTQQAAGVWVLNHPQGQEYYQFSPNSTAVTTWSTFGYGKNKRWPGTLVIRDRNNQTFTLAIMQGVDFALWFEGSTLRSRYRGTNHVWTKL